MNFFSWDEVQVLTFFHELVRISSLMIFLPIFGDKAVPPIVKILFGLSLSVVLHPVLWAQGYRVDSKVLDSQAALVFSICGEVFFGIFVGYVARWVFDIIQFAGNFAGTAMGFSMASVFDPHTETQTIAYAELLYILSAFLFLALDGHHIYLNAILESFKIVPLAGSKLLSMSQPLATYLIDMSAKVIGLGLILSAPVIVVTFIVNLTFGILARAVPQLNILVVSFATNIVVGLFIAIVSLPAFVVQVNNAFDSFLPEIVRFMHLFGT